LEEGLGNPGTTFILTSSDDIELGKTPRTCRVIRRVRRGVEEDALLVTVSPPLPADD
jgi:hypothetical protein